MILIIVSLLSLNSVVKAQNVNTIVNWHSMRATSDYHEQLEHLEEGKYLIVWVGYSNVEFFGRIQTGNNCYVDSLPGIPQGIIVGKKQDGRAIIEEKYNTLDLVKEATLRKIELLYIKKLTSSNISIEEQLLGNGFTEAEKPPETKNISSTGFRQPVGHTHTCPICGNSWDHQKNPTHKCDKAGCPGSQYVIDQPSRMVPIN